MTINYDDINTSYKSDSDYIDHHSFNYPVQGILIDANICEQCTFSIQGYSLYDETYIDDTQGKVINTQDRRIQSRVVSYCGSANYMYDSVELYNVTSTDLDSEYVYFKDEHSINSCSKSLNNDTPVNTNEYHNTTHSIAIPRNFENIHDISKQHLTTEWLHTYIDNDRNEVLLHLNSTFNDNFMCSDNSVINHTGNTFHTMVFGEDVSIIAGDGSPQNWIGGACTGNVNSRINLDWDFSTRTNLGNGGTGISTDDWDRGVWSVINESMVGMAIDSNCSRTTSHSDNDSNCLDDLLNFDNDNFNSIPKNDFNELNIIKYDKNFNISTDNITMLSKNLNEDLCIKGSHTDGKVDACSVCGNIICICSSVSTGSNFITNNFNNSEVQVLKNGRGVKCNDISVFSSSDTVVNLFDQNRYGFIANIPQSKFSSPNFVCKEVTFDWLMWARHKIKSTGVSNYKCAKIQLYSKFDFPLWEHHLQHYHDKNIVNYLKYGFPLSINGSNLNSVNMYNHTSAEKFPSEVKQYIATEINEKAMLGPYDQPPFTDFHTSPLLSRPKDNKSRRIIVDLSWPRGNSVNSAAYHTYDNLEYKLTYPSLDVIKERLLELGPSALLYKIDISRAFRNLPVDPIDIQFLGIAFDSKYYIDLSIPFGYIHGSACCQRVTDAIRYICNKNGFWLFNYCDDLIGIELPDRVYQAFDFTKNLVTNLGFPISKNKLIPPAAVVTCIGIEVSACDMEFRIPDEKIEVISQLCDKWVCKISTGKKAFQSLLGKLVYIAKCVKYARIFLGRMLSLYRENHALSHFHLTGEFFKDLMWFKKFMSSFNGSILIEPGIQFEIYLDASFSGLGAICHGMVYAYKLNLSNYANIGIVHLEMLNILVALRCWKKYFTNSKVKIYCDNAAVVAALTNFKIRDDMLLACTRNIWLELASSNIDMYLEHVKGSDNVYADILSRWYSKARFNSNDIYYLLTACTWFSIHDDFCNIDYVI